MKRRALLLVFSALAVASAATALVIGCTNQVDAMEIHNYFSGVDCVAPVLVSVKSQSGSIVRLEFNEPVKVYGDSFSPFVVRSDGKFIYVSLGDLLPPGVQTSIQGRVKDYSGNTCGFTVNVWGFNPACPRLLINEFTTKGSAKSPDRTELLALSDGNLNGMVLYGGTPEDYDCRIIFPDLDVRKGSYIVIWWTEELPDGIANDRDGVLNLCAATETGLSSNNGTLVLCDSPALGANVLDSVLYSNFSTSHGGFGTRSAMERAQWVIDCGGWKKDALDSTASTATRSMSRWLSVPDTDLASDWYITVTGGSTFGGANVTDEY